MKSQFINITRLLDSHTLRNIFKSFFIFSKVYFMIKQV